MKLKIAFVTLILLCCNTLFSQNSRYEKGYFIDSNNNKTACLIKNLEWDFNPTEFEYKTDENSKPILVKWNDFKEFSVGEEYTFKKATVKIDKSSDAIADATTNKATNFVEELLLLRVMIQGKATLYSYKTDNYSRFFYSVEDNLINPLTYKVYYDKQVGNYRTNVTYKQELLNNLKCETITQNDVERLEYSDSGLTNFFVKYNVCSGDLDKTSVGPKNHNTFELYAKAGVGFSSLYIDYDGHSADYSKKATPKLAVEVEINISEKKKKWSALAEVAYQQYSNSYYYDYVNDFTAEIDYKSIDMSVGLRRYFALNTNSNIYLSGYLTYKFAMNSQLKYSNSSTYLELRSTLAPTFGLGYVYAKKYLIELRYESMHGIIKSNNASSKFSTIGVMLGYKFL